MVKFRADRLNFTDQRGHINRCFILVVHIVDCRLGARRERQDLRLPLINLPRKRAPGQGEGIAALLLGFGFKKVGKSFGLGQIDAPTGKSATGEFARLGEPYALN